uniref:Uncharacterized protein n=1 Tax=Pararge aegeria TaxID=116150 RepID=S4PDD3_9NEOP
MVHTDTCAIDLLSVQYFSTAFCRSFFSKYKTLLGLLSVPNCMNAVPITAMFYKFPGRTPLTKQWKLIYKYALYIV